MTDIGWVSSVAPIAAGVAVGIAGRVVLAANDRRRDRAAALGQPAAAPSPAATPKAHKTLYAVPAGQR